MSEPDAHAHVSAPLLLHQQSRKQQPCSNSSTFKQSVSLSSHLLLLTCGLCGERVSRPVVLVRALGVGESIGLCGPVVTNPVPLRILAALQGPPGPLNRACFPQQVPHACNKVPAGAAAAAAAAAAAMLSADYDSGWRAGQGRKGVCVSLASAVLVLDLLLCAVGYCVGASAQDCCS